MNDAEREAWNARLFEQWLRERGKVTPPTDQPPPNRAERRRIANHMAKAQFDAQAKTRDIWEQIRDAMPPIQYYEPCALCGAPATDPDHDHEPEEE